MIIDFFTHFFRDWPDWWSVVWLSAIPVAESRVAVPLAMTYYQMDPILAAIFATLGAVVPTWLLLVFLEPASGFLSAHSPVCRKFFQWLFTRTRQHFVGQYEKYGLLALFLFVAAPVPGSGVWSGAVAAFIFGLNRPKAFLAIMAGAAAASAIVAAVTSGIFGVGRLLLFS